MPARFNHFLKTVWRKLPFRPVLLLVLALLLIEEQFPFSHFPMYSSFGDDAEVLFVAQQDGEPLAMRRVLRTGTATAKKMYKKELADITQAQQRDSNDATLEERKLAGERLLTNLLSRLEPDTLPASVTQLRIYIRTFSLAEDGTMQRLEPELLAIHPL